MKGSLKRSGIDELICYNEGPFDFLEIEPYLKDNSISDDTKRHLVERLGTFSFEEVCPFLIYLGESEKTFFLWGLISRLENLTFGEIEDFLRKEKVYIHTKRQIIERIQSVTFDEVEAFITDTSIPRLLRRALAENIIYDFDVEDYLDRNGYDGGVDSRSREINSWQLNELTQGIAVPDLIKGVPDERTLNFYYRTGQGAFKPHFEIFIKLLKQFIDGENSQVWNDFRVLHRTIGSEKVLGGVETEFVSGLNFRSKSSIYADTMHLTHGTPEKIPGTHAIVGEGLYRTPHKLKGILYRKRQYSKVPLLYTDRHSGGSENYNLGFPIGETVDAICDQILLSLQAAENRILMNIESNN